jgi:glycosyltransferase involved in cell wall biosynthesis
MAPTTSIVLCTYNGARFIAAQWASLLAQTRLPDEIVVRDDASVDASPALLDDLVAAARARGIAVRYVRNAKNLGYVANFEAALRDATGELLFLCDQDDVWHADKLAILVAEFKRRPSLLLMCSDAIRVDAAGTPLPLSLYAVLRLTRTELRKIHAGRGFEVLVRRSMATGATVALRRTLLDAALPFPAGWVHDEWLAIMAAALGGFDCTERALIDYRQHAANQLGMPERGLAAKWHGLVQPQAAYLERLMHRDAALAVRLRAFGSRVPDALRAAVADKLQHLEARRGTTGMPWVRLPSVLRELASGRYRRYASGWHSALRDLLRRG